MQIYRILFKHVIKKQKNIAIHHGQRYKKLSRISIIYTPNYEEGIDNIHANIYFFLIRTKIRHFF